MINKSDNSLVLSSFPKRHVLDFRRTPEITPWTKSLKINGPQTFSFLIFYLFYAESFWKMKFLSLFGLSAGQLAINDRNFVLVPDGYRGTFDDLNVTDLIEQNKEDSLFQKFENKVRSRWGLKTLILSLGITFGLSLLGMSKVQVWEWRTRVRYED